MTIYFAFSNYLMYNKLMRNLTQKGRLISNKIGKAIADFDLIKDKDKIIVAVSGGKDSLTLLKLLLERRRWAPISYEILAVHIITDRKCSGCLHKTRLEKIFAEWNCAHKFMNITLHSDKAHEISCFWCSWNRRKALFNLSSELGFNKIALGHHKDDIIETTLMNLFYKGEISAINAKQPLFEGKVNIIRPLAFIEESEIIAFARESGFPVQVCKCPNSEKSKRALMKRVIAEIHRENTQVRTNIFKAPWRIKHEYLCKCKKT